MTTLHAKEVNSTSHLLPSGGRLTIENLPERMMGPWSSAFWLRGPEGAARLQASARGSFERYVHTVESHSLTEEVAYRGLTIARHESKTGSSTTFVISSNHNELQVSLHGTGIPVDMVTSHIDGFELKDSVDGVQLSPISGSGYEVEVLAAINSLRSGIGLTAIPGTRITPYSLPHGRGSKVAGGELWGHHRRSTRYSSGKSEYVLSGKDAALTFAYSGWGRRRLALRAASTVTMSIAAA